MWRTRTASVQEAHIGIARIDGDVARLDSGRACAVLEVDGINLAMLDDDAREAKLAAFAGLLNALTHPIQILVRITPLNLAPYLRWLEERARREPSPTLAALGNDHAAHLRLLAVDRLLLEKRFYMVVTDEDAGEGRRFGRIARAEPGGEVARRLTFRCEELAKLLRRCDLAARRLDGTALAYLYRDWWGADGAADRSLADIADLGAPAVRARQRIRPAGLAPTEGGSEESPPEGAASPPQRSLLARLLGRRAAGDGDDAALHPDVARFAEGMATVADFIAPAAIEVDRDWIRLDSTYARALAITG